MTVDLDGLTSGQMYYCKAAATNTTSASCGGPVVGGVKVFFSLIPMTVNNTPGTCIGLIVILCAPNNFHVILHFSSYSYSFACFIFLVRYKTILHMIMAEYNKVHLNQLINSIVIVLINHLTPVL